MAVGYYNDVETLLALRQGRRRVMASRTRLKRRLSAKRQAARIAEFKLYASTPVPKGLAAVTYTTGLLSRYRRLGDLGRLPRRTARALRRRLTGKLAAALDTLKLRPADFGTPDLDTLARHFATALERFGYFRYSAKGLRKVRGNMFGLFFHLLARHERGLVKLRADLAKATLKELNKLAATGSPQLVIAANTSKPPPSKAPSAPYATPPASPSSPAFAARNAPWNRSIP